jgi:hypothetical protein
VICIVKLLDWGEDGFATENETAFKQEVAVWHELGHPNVTKVNMPIIPLFSIMIHVHLPSLPVLILGRHVLDSWCCPL